MRDASFGNREPVKGAGSTVAEKPYGVPEKHSDVSAGTSSKHRKEEHTAVQRARGRFQKAQGASKKVNNGPTVAREAGVAGQRVFAGA